MDEPKLHHAQVILHTWTWYCGNKLHLITDDWGDKQEFYILVSPDYLCAAKPPPPKEGYTVLTIVNLHNATEEEGFEQCYYMLPRWPYITGFGVNSKLGLYSPYHQRSKRTFANCLSPLTFLFFLYVGVRSPQERKRKRTGIVFWQW